MELILFSLFAMRVAKCKPITLPRDGASALSKMGLTQKSGFNIVYLSEQIETGRT
jgi:hypothetical protein